MKEDKNDKTFEFIAPPYEELDDDNKAHPINLLMHIKCGSDFLDM